MKIALVGYGKMGKAIEEMATARGHQIVARIGRDGFTPNQITDADACIEFTTPEVGFDSIKKCVLAGKPVVSGTTGWLERWNEMTDLVQTNQGAFLYASNFSLGVNIFFAINKYAARIMNHFEQYDVEVHEIHHTQKLDAPSGTAITIAEQIVEELDRKRNFQLDASANETLKITAERKDPVPGTHIVKYKSAIDDIELSHTAHSRKGFAIGAVMAAEWLVDKRGVFGMEDMLNLKDFK